MFVLRFLEMSVQGIANFEALYLWNGTSYGLHSGSKMLLIDWTLTWYIKREIVRAREMARFLRACHKYSQIIFHLTDTEEPPIKDTP